MRHINIYQECYETVLIEKKPVNSVEIVRSWEYI